MGIASWFKNILGQDRKASSNAEHWIVNLFGAGSTYNDWTSNRLELAGHFRGWNYCAINALATEVACMQPQVANIISAEEQKAQVQKSLRGIDNARGAEKKFLIRKFIHKRLSSDIMRRKALVQIQAGHALEPVEQDDPCATILRNPNEPDVAFTFFYRLIMNLRLHGVEYTYVHPNMGGTPHSLWVIPTHWVHEKRGVTRFVDYYEIKPARSTTDPANSMLGGWYPGYSGRGVLLPEHVVKIAYPHPDSLTGGYSPLMACATWTDISEAIDSTRVNTFINHMLPGVIIQIDKDVRNPDKAQLERIQATFAEKYATAKNARKPVVLAPGLTIVPVPTAQEMEYHSSADQSRDNSLATHRTPKAVIGLTETTSLANLTASWTGFYQTAVKPNLVLIGQILTEKLAKRWDKRKVIYWDNPVPDDPEQTLKRAQILGGIGVMTPNQIRLEYGWEPHEYGGDNPLVNGQEMPWGTGQLPPPPGQVDAGMGGDPEMQDRVGKLDQMLEFANNGDGEEDDGDGSLDTPLGGGEDAAEIPHESLPTPLAKRLGRVSTNGNGKHH